MRYFLLSIMMLLISVPAIAQDKVKVGVIGAANPSVSVEGGDNPRDLAIGDDIFFQETITTDADGTAQLLFLDKSALSVGSNASVTVDSFVFDPAKADGEMVIDGAKGAFRFIGGALSKKKAVKIKTPVSTIGIRGGIVMVDVNPRTGATNATFVYGHEMTIENMAGDIERVTAPGLQVGVLDAMQPPTAPVRINPAEFIPKMQMLESRAGQSGGAKVVPQRQQIKRGLKPVSDQPEPIGNIPGTEPGEAPDSFAGAEGEEGGEGEQQGSRRGPNDRRGSGGPDGGEFGARFADDGEGQEGGNGMMMGDGRGGPGSKNSRRAPDGGMMRGPAGEPMMMGDGRMMDPGVMDGDQHFFGGGDGYYNDSYAGDGDRYYDPYAAGNDYYGGSPDGYYDSQGGYKPPDGTYYDGGGNYIDPTITTQTTYYSAPDVNLDGIRDFRDDIDRNGFVDDADIHAFNWIADLVFAQQADFNGDGKVGPEDVRIYLSLTLVQPTATTAIAISDALILNAGGTINDTSQAPPPPAPVTDPADPNFSGSDLSDLGSPLDYLGGSVAAAPTVNPIGTDPQFIRSGDISGAPTCTNCQFVDWGVWKADADTYGLDPTVNANIQGNKDIPFYVIGDTTNNLQALSGTGLGPLGDGVVTYNGITTGRSYQSGTLIDHHNGTFTSTVDIDNRKITNFDATLNLPDSTTITFGTTADVLINDTGHAVFTGGVTGIDSLDSSTVSGNINGALFGPSAQGIGGNYEVQGTGGTPETAKGVFVGGR